MSGLDIEGVLAELNRIAAELDNIADLDRETAFCRYEADAVRGVASAFHVLVAEAYDEGYNQCRYGDPLVTYGSNLNPYRGES